MHDSGAGGSGGTGGSGTGAGDGRLRLLTQLALALGSLCLGLSACASELKIATVHFEQNATDRDVEVVFAAKGGAEGLAKLLVVGPDGRTVIDFSAPDTSTLGIREFHFESPEPQDVEGLKAAYPEGVYRFSAATVGGKELWGRSTLSHTLPPPTAFRQPPAKSEDVSYEHLELRWDPVAGVSGYIVEIAGSGSILRVSLPADPPSFHVPEGFLKPATHYELEIATVSEAGNVSVIETGFTTRR